MRRPATVPQARVLHTQVAAAQRDDQSKLPVLFHDGVVVTGVKQSIIAGAQRTNARACHMRAWGTSTRGDEKSVFGS